MYPKPALRNMLGNKVYIIAPSPKFHSTCTHFHFVTIDPVNALVVSLNKQTLVSHCGESVPWNALEVVKINHKSYLQHVATNHTPRQSLKMWFEGELQTLQKFMEPRNLVEPFPCHLILILKIACIVTHISHQPHSRPIVATLTLGSQPKQKGCKVASQEEGSPRIKTKALQGCGPKGSRGVTSHTPGSVRKCEGVWGSEHSHSQATPTLGNGVPVDFRNFREQFEGSKLNGLWRSLYHWKVLGM